MTVSPIQFQSISNLTKWLIRFIVVTTILISIYTLIPDVYSFENNSWVASYLIFLIFTLIILVLTIVMTLVWYYRATKNIHSFGAREVTSPIMAVIWWFVPIFQLWKPYSVSQQIWKASKPEINLSRGTEWKNTSGSNIIKIWWILELASLLSTFIVALLVGVTLGLTTDATEADIDQLVQSNDMLIMNTLIVLPSIVLSIISAIYFIRMIRMISDSQELKSGTSI